MRTPIPSKVRKTTPMRRYPHHGQLSVVSFVIRPKTPVIAADISATQSKCFHVIQDAAFLSQTHHLALASASLFSIQIISYFSTQMLFRGPHYREVFYTDHFMGFLMLSDQQRHVLQGGATSLFEGKDSPHPPGKHLRLVLPLSIELAYPQSRSQQKLINYRPTVLNQIYVVRQNIHRQVQCQYQIVICLKHQKFFRNINRTMSLERANQVYSPQLSI